MFVTKHACVCLALLLLVLASGLAAAQTKPRIEKAADLPRFTYKIDGKVEDVVRSPDKFAPFAAAVRRDTESVLADYDIPDKATRTSLIGLLATLDYLDGRYDSVLRRVDELRALQDKPADKLLAAMRLKAMAHAAKADGPTGEAYQRDVAAAIAARARSVALRAGREQREGGQGRRRADRRSAVLGRIREVVQPIVDRNGSLSSDFAPGIVSARFALLDVLPLKQTLVDSYRRYLAAHQVAKADIWAARDVTLTPAQTRGPVVIGIWDSGVDTVALSPAGGPRRRQARRDRLRQVQPARLPAS